MWIYIIFILDFLFDVKNNTAARQFEAKTLRKATLFKIFTL